jgi:hypothetical protein
VHFDIRRGVPEHFTLTGGTAGEGRQLQSSLRPEHCYVLDRGFQSDDLLGEIIQTDSDFVVRLRKSDRYEVIEPRGLTAADLAAGVQSDTLVRVGWRADRTAELPPLRRVAVRVEGKDEPLVLLTSCLDLPAELIALMYQHRWQVELFFRWLKCMTHREHFYSESPEGMTLQLYVTLIATLLIALEMGARPSVYDFSRRPLGRRDARAHQVGGGGEKSSRNCGSTRRSMPDSGGGDRRNGGWSQSNSMTRSVPLAIGASRSRMVRRASGVVLFHSSSLR